MKVSEQAQEKTNKDLTVLYDADAEKQTLRYKFEHRKKLFPVEHTFRSPTDSELFEYERRRNVRMREASREELGERGVAMNSDATEAAVWLWDKLIISVSGYKDSPDWKTKTPKTHKEYSITKGLLMCEVYKPVVSDAETDEFFDFDIESSEGADINLKCYFGRNELETSHVLQYPTAKQINKYNSLMQTSYQVRGSRLGSSDIRIPSKAKKLGSLYDEDDTFSYWLRVSCSSSS